MAIQVLKPKFHVDECLDEIRECLEKGWTGMGFKTVEFETKWKEYTGHENAHYLNSATVGLEMAFEILKMENNWSDNDEVITTPLTFVSTNHAILHANLHPCFADVDEYLCLDPVDVEVKINEKTKAVIFVGYGGRVGKLTEIIELCKKHNLKLILDAAHMAGTTVDGVTPGSFNGIDVTVYSFQAVKNLPTADSGMICFKDEKLDSICRKLSWLGINKDTYARTTNSGSYKWKYDVEYAGYKNHGNSIMASIGLVQLKYLDEDNEYRNNLALQYNKLFENNKNIRIIPTTSDSKMSYHIYAIEVDNRDELLEELAQNDIFAGVHYRDNTEYNMYSYAKGTCPNSHKVSERVISLPLHLELTSKDVEKVAGIVNSFTQK